MSDWKPGTVAKATVRGVRDLLVMRTSGTRGGDDIWLTALHVGGWRSHTSDDVTDVRPLVVLDLNGTYGCWADQGDPSVIVRSLRETHSAPAQAIADQIEAQTKPPRIPEPGLWGVVEARDAADRTGMPRMYLRDTVSDENPHWTAIGHGVRVEWDDLIDPILVREGVA